MDSTPEQDIISYAYQGETTVRICCNTRCQNNRYYLGDARCNCKEIEIDLNGCCVWFTPKNETENK